jgi:hypothetical protein
MQAQSLLRLWLLAALVAASSSLLACGDEEVENPEGANEQEIITTVALTFSPRGGGDAVEAQFRDADGPGGDAPTKAPIALKAGTTYDLSLELLNETVSPDAEEYNIGAEIEEEAEEHQFLYSGSALEGTVTFEYADKESDYPNGNQEGDDLPVGLRGTVVAAAPGSGTFTVTLKHLPPLNDTPVKTADVSDDDGETDISVDFDLTVE